MVEWADFPISGRMWRSGDETLTTRAMASLENVIPNDAGGHSRFPGLEYFAIFPGKKVFLRNYKDELYAGTDLGQLWRVSSLGNAVDVTGVPISGGRRWTFSETDDGAMLMAAGGPIIRLSGNTTDALSPAAPETTHVAYIDGYVLALERESNRWQYSNPGEPSVWDPLNVFSANAVGEKANHLIVTPYREIIVGGEKHMEQWETQPNGDQPFARRWTTGQGCKYPYTLVSDATGTYGVNGRNEFVRFAGQVSQEQSEDIAEALDLIDDWTEAWAAEMTMFGQRMIALVTPNATNLYGTKGVAFAYDYRAHKFMFLYGPARQGLPTAWPVTSVARAYGRMFAGVPGGVAVFDQDCCQVLGEEQRCLIRTPHVDKFGTSRIDDLRIRLKRGEGIKDRPLRREPSSPYLRENYRQLLREAPLPQEGMVGLRVNRDNEGWDEWQWEPTGDHGENQMVIRFGGQGCADTWQFELAVSDAVPFELVKMQVYVERLSR